MPIARTPFSVQVPCSVETTQAERRRGSRHRAVEFLADLHRRRAFDPFTTDELIDDVLAAQEEVDRPELERWLFAEPGRHDEHPARGGRRR